jgi:exopolysaccharide biosynthesis polyprenyl glycosylphosphotransferase
VTITKPPTELTEQTRPLRSAPLTLVVVDVLCVNVGFFLSWYARYVLEIGSEVSVFNYLSWVDYVGIQAALTVLLVVSVGLRGLYTDRVRQSLTEEMNTILWGSLVAIAVMIVAVFYFRPFGYSRLVFVYAWVLITALLLSVRVVDRLIKEYQRRRGIGLRKVVVVGGGDIGRRVVQSIIAQPEIGFQLVGIVDDDGDSDLGRIPWLGRIDAIPELISRLSIDEVIIALPSPGQGRVSDILRTCARQRVVFRVVPDLFQLSLDQLDVVQLSGIPLIGVREPALPTSQLLLKRVVDVLAASIALVLAMPLLVLVALVIRLESPGSILIRQTRVGRNGRAFSFYKFRSMRQDADRQLNQLQTKNEASGPIFKIRNDPRRTRVGAIIRKLSIDELPQIYNVLRGDMSLVGPRPPFQWEVEKYQDWHHKRLSVAPGLTGLWQVSGRSDLPFDEMALLDLWYIDNWSVGLDIRILLRTIPAVLSGRGAY